MKSLTASIKSESVLFIRNMYGFIFTFVFPLLMLFLFGSIYGNEPTPFYGGRGSMDVTTPSYIGMIIAVNALMSFPLVLTGYKARGVYKRFDATPAGKGIVIASQLIVNFLMTILGILLLIMVAKAVYGIRIDGNLWAICGYIALSIASLFALGFFLTSLIRDEKITKALCYLFYFVMLFASGASLPSEMFPEGVKLFSRFLPLTYVVELLKSAFAGKDFSSCSLYIWVLVALGCVFSGLGALLYRRQRWN